MRVFLDQRLIEMLTGAGRITILYTRARTITEKIENQFHAVRHANFFENVEQVVLHRVLTNAERVRNFSVRKALHKVFDNLAFTLGK